MGLLDFAPEYIVSSLSAIAIMGDSPYDFCERGEKESCCLFWLSANYFKLKNNEDSNDKGTDRHPKYRPFGFYAMKLKNKKDIMEYVKQCTAKLPMLERVSLLITSYYIIVGVKEGFSMIKGTVVCKHWAYLSFLFSWTLISIWKRGIYGIQVVKDPKDVFKKNIEIIVDDNPIGEFPFRKCATVTITALLSIVYPWGTVLIVYFTPPVGYYCRSKYVTVICSIWSFNSALAYIYHIKGESDLIMSEESDLIVSGNGWLHVWFCTSGFIVAILVLFIGIFTGYDFEQDKQNQNESDKSSEEDNYNNSNEDLSQSRRISSTWKYSNDQTSQYSERPVCCKCQSVFGKDTGISTLK
ncbi:10241_t:CDS:2 [Funneliformis caledonium]|uniref:10241_t:CDS:1 n=1 Tax=Funneliformis caledonium TaxID=1117310 RepID=A0A9N8YK15_9GLOM|nr:10241_t:CDS:2 [Funneliformis caledonium]